MKPADADAPELVDLVELELERGAARGRVLRLAAKTIRVEPGPYGLVRYTLALVAIEGEPRPRWIDASRIVGAESRER